LEDFYLNVEEISIENEKTLIDSENIEKNLIWVYEKIEQKENIEITLKLKTIDDIKYEFGCLFYKQYKENDERHLNLILDEWEEQK